MRDAITDKYVTLGHGSGGLLTSRLIKNLILKYFPDPVLRRLEDSAALGLQSTEVAFTTDSYVVDPIFFPGGDIGKLAICGTVNDLAMKGAIPQYISMALIIEEGFPFADLENVLASAALAAKKARVRVVCGDTKVVDKGKADKIFINTSGVGIIKRNLGKERIRIRDRVIISGTVGDHGIAVMNERLKLGLKSKLKSDVAALNILTNKLMDLKLNIHFMRDPTRGGVVSALNEVAYGAKWGVILDEKKIPVRKEVLGASEMLGLDPLYIANEGKFIAFVDCRSCSDMLKALRSHPLGRDAAIIGEVVKKPKGVWLKTRVGGTRPLLQFEAEGLPRIC